MPPNLYYVSPPIDQYLKFKNHYSLVLIQTGKRGMGESLTREKVRGTTVHKAGSKIPTQLDVY
jgi:hypothetical protein